MDYSHSISLGNISSQCTANAIIFTLAMSVPWNVKQQMVDMYGCCLNAMNTTSIDENDIHHLVIRYDLWTACDVETPGFCSFPFDLFVYDDVKDCVLKMK